MYQVGISSFEDARLHVCPEADQVSPEAAAFLNREDLDNSPEIFLETEETRSTTAYPSFNKSAMLLVAGVLGVSALSSLFFTGTEPAENQAANATPITGEIASNNNNTIDPLVDVLSRAAQPDPGIDTMLTGSIAEPTPVQVQRIHIIRSGDTLSGIANKYGTSIKEIVAQNGIENPNRLKLNTKLLIR